MVSAEEVAEREQEQENRAGIERCLAICAHLSQQVNHSRRDILENGRQTPSSTPEDFPAFLQEISDGFAKKQSDLQARLQLQTFATEVRRMQASLWGIYEQTRRVQINVFEQVAAAERARQWIISSPETVTSARGVYAGRESQQYLGNVPAEAVIQQSRYPPYPVELDNHTEREEDEEDGTTGPQPVSRATRPDLQGDCAAIDASSEGKQRKTWKGVMRSTWGRSRRRQA